MKTNNFTAWILLIFNLLAIMLTTYSSDAPVASSSELWHIVSPSSSPVLDNLWGDSLNGYYVEIEIGTPPQKFNVVIDTGSSNLAVAASPAPQITKFFNVSQSKSFIGSDSHVRVPFTQGWLEGMMGNDVVRIPSLPHLPDIRCDILAINSSSEVYINGSNWQGILGLGYAAIAKPDSNVMTFLKAFAMKNISTDFSLQLCGGQKDQAGHWGSFNVGDASRGDLYEIAGINTSQSAYLNHEWFYEVVLTNISVNSNIIDVPCDRLNDDKTIVDSGTTNLRLPHDVFTIVLSLIKDYVHKKGHLERIGAEFWTNQGFLCWRHDDSKLFTFPNISLSLAHSRFTAFELLLTPESYIRHVVSAKGIPPGLKCHEFAISPSHLGTVLGAVVLEGFHVVFNRAEKRVEFSLSDCGPNVGLSGLLYTEDSFVLSDLFVCKPHRQYDSTALTVAAYLICGLCVLSALPLLFCLLQWIWLRVLVPRNKRPSPSASTCEVQLINRNIYSRGENETVDQPEL